MITTEQHFNEAKDLLNFLCSWNNNLSGYVFRGHSDESFQLLPSVLRDNSRYLADNQYPRTKVPGQLRNSDREWHQIQHERIILRDFYKLADNHGLKVPNVEKLRNSLIGRYDYNFTQQGRIEWLSQDILEVAALAQHYGIPTRLLDWSYDPFVSSYFAASGVTDDSGNLAVWCFNAEYLSTWLNTNSRLKLKLIIPPYSENSNLSAQRGLFTHMPVEFDFSNNDNASVPVDRTPLDIKLDNILPPEPHTQNREKIFLKLTLPCSKAKDLLKFLLQQGYGEARIYPGYKGIANQVMRKYK